MRKNKKPRYILMVVWLIFFSNVLSSCLTKQAHLLADTAEATPVVAPTNTTAALPKIDLIIDLKNARRKTIEIQEGQIFQVKPPGLASEWQVDFSPSLFIPLTAPEMMRSPGKDGWTFQTVSQGQGVLVFTSIVSCTGPVPCPMMPVRLELTLTVR